MKSLVQEISTPSIIARIDTLNEKALDLLAWQFHADFYDSAFPCDDDAVRVDMKRDAVLNALKLHMKKGTAWAILEALRQLDVQAEFVPWWQFDGTPYTFRIEAVVAGDFYKTSGRDILVKSIVRAVNDSKSARSYMAYLDVNIHEQQRMNINARLFPYEDFRVDIHTAAPDIKIRHELSAGLTTALEAVMQMGIPRQKDTRQDIRYRAFLSATTEANMGLRMCRPDDEVAPVRMKAGLSEVKHFQGVIRVDTTERQKHIIHAAGIFLAEWVMTINIGDDDFS